MAFQHQKPPLFWRQVSPRPVLTQIDQRLYTASLDYVTNEVLKFHNIPCHVPKNKKAIKDTILQMIDQHDIRFSPECGVTNMPFSFIFTGRPPVPITNSDFSQPSGIFLFHKDLQFYFRDDPPTPIPFHIKEKMMGVVRFLKNNKFNPLPGFFWMFPIDQYHVSKATEKKTPSRVLRPPPGFPPYSNLSDSEKKEKAERSIQVIKNEVSQITTFNFDDPVPSRKRMWRVLKHKTPEQIKERLTETLEYLKKMTSAVETISHEYQIVSDLNHTLTFLD